jgi:hypothetical protein
MGLTFLSRLKKSVPIAKGRRFSFEKSPFFGAFARLSGPRDRTYYVKIIEG